MEEGASDACLNRRGQGKEIKQKCKEALSGKRVGVKEKASVHNFPYSIFSCPASGSLDRVLHV